MNLNRYTVLLSCVPFPFQVTVVAANEESAIRKAKWEGRGLELGRVLEITLTETFEMKPANEVIV